MFNSLIQSIGIPIHKDVSLGYRIWHMKPEGFFTHSECLIAGEDAYAQILYTIEIKPNISDLDPGPLDAKVP